MGEEKENPLSFIVLNISFLMAASLQANEAAFFERAKEVRKVAAQDLEGTFDLLKREFKSAIFKSSAEYYNSETQKSTQRLIDLCQGKIKLIGQLWYKQASKPDSRLGRLKKTLTGKITVIEDRLTTLRTSFDTKVMKEIKTVRALRKELLYVIQRVEKMRLEDMTNAVLSELHHRLLLLDLQIMHTHMHDSKLGITTSSTHVVAELAERLKQTPHSETQHNSALFSWMNQRITEHLDMLEKKKSGIAEKEKYLKKKPQLTALQTKIDQLKAFQRQTQGIEDEKKEKEERKKGLGLGYVEMWNRLKWRTQQGSPLLDQATFVRDMSRLFFQPNELDLIVRTSVYETQLPLWQAAIHWFMNHLYHKGEKVKQGDYSMFSEIDASEVLKRDPSYKPFWDQKTKFLDAFEEEMGTGIGTVEGGTQIGRLNPEHESHVKALDAPGKFKWTEAFEKDVKAWATQLYITYEMVATREAKALTKDAPLLKDKANLSSTDDLLKTLKKKVEKDFARARLTGDFGEVVQQTTHTEEELARQHQPAPTPTKPPIVGPPVPPRVTQPIKRGRPEGPPPKTAERKVVATTTTTTPPNPSIPLAPPLPEGAKRLRRQVAHAFAQHTAKLGYV